MDVIELTVEEIAKVIEVRDMMARFPDALPACVAQSALTWQLKNTRLKDEGPR